MSMHILEDRLRGELERHCYRHNDFMRYCPCGESLRSHFQLQKEQLKRQELMDAQLNMSAPLICNGTSAVSITIANEVKPKSKPEPKPNKLLLLI